MELFDRPAIVDEAERELVEEFGMTWTSASGTEVIGIGGQRTAKVPEPNSVHHHAGRQRILGRGNPVGERESPAVNLARQLESRGRFVGQMKGSRGPSGDDGDDSWFDFIARREWIASYQDMSRIDGSLKSIVGKSDRSGYGTARDRRSAINTQREWLVTF